jgi:hypothetical protein
MMDGVDFMDDMDTEKIHLRGCVHCVHNVHFVNYLDKFSWLQLPNPGSKGENGAAIAPWPLLLQ